MSGTYDDVMVSNRLTLPFHEIGRSVSAVNASSLSSTQAYHHHPCIRGPSQAGADIVNDISAGRYDDQMMVHEPHLDTTSDIKHIRAHANTSPCKLKLSTVACLMFFDF